MLRRILCMVCAAVMLLAVIGSGSQVSADNQTLRNRKIVSVVYDDSGSMAGEKWEYTNYAMQCFAAMLNSEDRLDITYMSSYTRGSFSVDTGNRADSVKAIRNHNQSGGTPINAVDTAFHTLKSANDTDATSEYWLIVMTDGQMGAEGEAKKKIDKLAEETMPNGTKPHIIYLTICDVGGDFTPSFNKSNIESRSALTAGEIVQVISEIACDISGRYAIDPGDIKVVDDTTVQITSDLPLLNIGILTQRSPAKVQSIKGAEGAQLKEECNVPVAAPDVFLESIKADDRAALKGNVALYNNQPANIPAGTYTITFTEPISKDDLVIMFEPAYELRLEIYVNGVKVDDPSILEEEDVVDVEAFLYEIGTDNRIAMGMLPSGYQCNIAVEEDGKVVKNDSGLRLEGIKLKHLDTKFTAQLEVPGFFLVRDVIELMPQPIKLSGLTAELYYDGSPRRTEEGADAPDADNVVYITELKTNETGVRFTLYLEGQPITKERALLMQERFTESLKLDFDNYKVTVCDDGTIIVAPTKTWVPAIFYWWSHRGDSVIGAEIDGLSASETICFKMGDWWKVMIEIIKILIYIFLSVYLILWLFVKPHFRRGVVRVYRAYDRFSDFALVAGTVRRVHYLASSGPLNFFGLRGMRRRIKTTKYVVRVVDAGYYELSNVKGKHVSLTDKPSSALAPCQDKVYGFSNCIYIYDGTSYYKIEVS